MTLILAIDQSTSATKAMLFNEKADLLDQVSVTINSIFRPGRVEHVGKKIYKRC